MKGGKKKILTISSFPLFSSPPRIHPGVFLAGTLSLLVFFLTLPEDAWRFVLIPWIVALLFSLAGCPHPWKPLLKMTGILPFLILALILHAFFTPGTILWHVGPLYMTKEGLREGAWIMQKLGFFFYLSFVITSGIPSRFLFQLLERLGRFPPFKKLNLRLWILSLFLIVRWLRILPASWKFRVSEAVRDEPGRLGKTLKGLRHIPLILRAEVSGMGLWVQCLVLRGYAEGILVLAETPLPPLKTRDILIISGIFLAWAGWIIYLL